MENTAQIWYFQVMLDVYSLLTRIVLTMAVKNV